VTPARDINPTRVKTLLQSGDGAVTSAERGKALEDLACYLFSKVPGISVEVRNAIDVLQSAEIDIGLYNSQSRRGFVFLGHSILVECKNHNAPVSSHDVVHFITKLKDGGCRDGFLIARNGITGDPTDETSAHRHIANALRDEFKVFVITGDEILALRSTAELVALVRYKLSKLVVRHTSI
jgi:restriction endonuclease